MKCICGYSGPSGPVGTYGARESLLCPDCGCSSRHRAVGWACLNPFFGGFVYQVGESALTPFLRRCSLRLVVSELDERPGCIYQNLELIRLPPNYFNLVICSDVLEHVRDYCAALSGLVSVVARSGMLAITVPEAPDVDAHFSFCQVSNKGPEYDVWAKDAPVHLDPLDPNGCRVYRTYGRDLLMRELRKLGMISIRSTAPDIPEYGVVNSPVILGTKP